MNVAAQFGENVAACREQLGISQEDLGFRADLHRTQISDMERGLRVPRIDTLVKLAASLQIDPADLLAGITWQPGEMRPGSFRRSD